MLRAIARISGTFACLASLTLVAVWLGSRLVSDRWHYWQYLSWVPSWMWLGPSLLLCVLGTLVRIRARRAPRAVDEIAGYGSPIPSAPAAPPAPAPLPRWPRRLFWTTVAANVAAAGWVGFFEYRLLNALRLSEPNPSVPVLRLINWNLTMPDTVHWSGDLRSIFPGRAPDVVLLTTNQRRAVLEASVATFGEGYQLERYNTFAIATRVPLLDATYHSFDLTNTEVKPTEAGGIDPQLARRARRRLEDTWNQWADTLGIARRIFPNNEDGGVLVIRLDTTQQLGRPSVIWLMDLPSDPFLFRWHTAARVQQRLTALRAQKNAKGEPVLAEPDLVLGDFNTPRGSASLDLMVPGLEHAFDQAGWGLAASWPRGVPMLHLDHTFVAPGLRAISYKLVRTPVSDHYAQLVELTAVRPSR